MKTAENNKQNIQKFHRLVFSDPPKILQPEKEQTVQTLNRLNVRFSVRIELVMDFVHKLTMNGMKQTSSVQTDTHTI